MPRWMTWVTDRLRPIRMTNTAEKTVQVGVVQGNMTVVNVIQGNPCLHKHCEKCRHCGQRLAGDDSQNERPRHGPRTP